MHDFQEQVEKLAADLATATEKVEMAHEALDSVIETTGNFREGFYSLKLVRSLAKTTIKQIHGVKTGPTIERMEELLQSLNNLYAIIMTEIARLEK